MDRRCEPDFISGPRQFGRMWTFRRYARFFTDGRGGQGLGGGIIPARHQIVLIHCKTGGLGAGGQVPAGPSLRAAA